MYLYICGKPTYLFSNLVSFKQFTIIWRMIIHHKDRQEAEELLKCRDIFLYINGCGIELLHSCVQ